MVDSSARVGLFLIVFLLASVGGTRAEVIAWWTGSDLETTSTLGVVPTTGTLTLFASISRVGVEPHVMPEAFSSREWPATQEPDPAKYHEVILSTRGYKDVALQFVAVSQNDGPKRVMISCGTEGAEGDFFLLRELELNPAFGAGKQMAVPIPDDCEDVRLRFHAYDAGSPLGHFQQWNPKVEGWTLIGNVWMVMGVGDVTE